VQNFVCGCVKTFLAAQSGQFVAKKALDECSEEIRSGGFVGSMQKAENVSWFIVTYDSFKLISGRLEEVLARNGLNYYEKQYRIKQKLSTRWLIASCRSVSILYHPFLVGIYRAVLPTCLLSMEVSCLWLRKLVLKLSAFFQHYWWLNHLTSRSLSWRCSSSFWKKGPSRLPIYVVQLKIPILGNLLYKNLASANTQNAESLISSSSPLQAIEITSQCCGQSSRRECPIASTKKDCWTRRIISEADGGSLFFPHSIIPNDGSVGESVVELRVLTRKFQKSYDQRSTRIIRIKLQVLIEPNYVIFLPVMWGESFLDCCTHVSMFETFG